MARSSVQLALLRGDGGAREEPQSRIAALRQSQGTRRRLAESTIQLLRLSKRPGSPQHRMSIRVAPDRTVRQGTPKFKEGGARELTSHWLIKLPKPSQKGMGSCSVDGE